MLHYFLFLALGGVLEETFRRILTFAEKGKNPVQLKEGCQVEVDTPHKGQGVSASAWHMARTDDADGKDT